MADNDSVGETALADQLYDFITCLDLTTLPLSHIRLVAVYCTSMYSNTDVKTGKP